MTAINHIFNQEEFDKLLETSLHKYADSIEDFRTRGAIVKITGDWPAQFVNQVTEYAKQGYQQHSNLTPDFSAQLYSSYMVKPAKLQRADIEVIEAEVKANYLAELQRRYDAHVETMASETVQRAKRQREKDEAEAEAALLEYARAEALSVLGSRPE